MEDEFITISKQELQKLIREAVDKEFEKRNLLPQIKTYKGEFVKNTPKFKDDDILG